MNEASLQFHIEANDYFGTLATVLDLVTKTYGKKANAATQKLSCVSETV